MTYGDIWQNLTEEYYKKMFDNDWRLHLEMQTWLLNHRFENILEIGCGTGQYAEYFGERFVGIDVSRGGIETARKTHPCSRFIYGDYLETDLPDKYDLVMSVASIDCVYDMNKFIMKAIENSRKYVVIINYNSYNNDIYNHHYIHREDGDYYENIISLREIRRLLYRYKFTITPIEREPERRNAFMLEIHV